MIANMRYVVAGLLQVAGVIWVVYYAASPDEYYAAPGSPDTISHWEHASNGGAAGYAVGAMVIASAIAVVFLAMGLVPRWRRGGPAVLGGVAYLISLYAAFIFLSFGH
jgi:hypothetical protein